MSYKINYTAEEKIKLAKDDSVEKLYESKKNQRTVRVVTVLAYCLTVSMAAIILSTYYVFIWNPKHLRNNGTYLNQQFTPLSRVTCDPIIVPENIAIRLINNSEVSVDSFYDEIKKHLQKLQSEALRIDPKMTRLEFNRYLKDISATTVSMDRKMRKKMNKKKIIDDEDLNMDMESSGDKDQQPVTTFPSQLTSDANSDLNDTTIIFDQEPDE